MTGGPPEGAERDLVDRAVAAIDAVNEQDPVRLVVDGVERPKEVVHAERMTHWVTLLDPNASAAQLIAARAHHLRRWASPRTEYPEGRAGYLRWRTDQKARHAREVGELLRGLGADDALVERVAAIVAKRELRTDPATQTHEDALCLVFLEQQLDGVADQLGTDHVVDVLRRTAAKMSPAGLQVAAGLPLTDHGRALLAAALDAPA
jgi:hypothetical protein